MTTLLRLLAIAGIILPGIVLAQTVPVTGTAQLPAQTVTIPAQTVMIPIAGTSVPFPIPAQTITLPAVSAVVVGTATIPSVPVTPPVVTPPVTVTPRQSLLNYLTAQAAAKKPLVCQHSDIWVGGNGFQSEALLKTQTGKEPGMMSFPVDASGNSENGFADATTWSARGGLVMMSWWLNEPVSMNWATAATEVADLAPYYTAGTPQNTALNAYVDPLAAKLKALPFPFVLRVPIEVNGTGWSWFHTATTAKEVAFQQYLYNRIVNVDGVSQAIWTYNPNGGVGNYTQDYPGDTDTAVVGLDSYGTSNPSASWPTSSKSAFTAETGVIWQSNYAPPVANSGDSMAVWNAMIAGNPSQFAICYFTQGFALAYQNNAAAVMAAGVTLDQVPKLY